MIAMIIIMVRLYEYWKNLDLSSQEKINNLNTDDLKKGVNMIKSLKGIEKV